MYNLSNENVLKMDEVTRLGILEVLTYLSYRQDLNSLKQVNI